MIPYTITHNSLTALIGGLPQVFDTTHTNFSKILAAIINGDEELVVSLSDTAKEISKYGKGCITVVGGVVLHNGMELHNYAVDKLLQFMEEGLPIDPIIKFLENLMENPSYRAVQELYEFLEVGSMPLTEDGHFLCYKKVTKDFKDIYTGAIDNSVGAICSMPRNQVDENSNQTCSNGLHACSYDYLDHFGSSTGNKVIVVKINPKDVVSIPKDYNSTKMRVCQYEVIQDVTEAYNKKHNVLSETPLYRAPVGTIGQFTALGNLLDVYSSAVEAERATGIYQQNIHAVCSGRRLTAGGYYWQYL